MNKLRFFLILPILIIGSLVNSARAQDTVIRIPEKGKLDSLNSGILQQKRLIEVFVPPGYKPGSTDKYDVLYVLDGGNWNTGLVKETQHFLENEAYMPPVIIVSVLGIDRNKDLTPTHLADSKTSGGADKFLGFIKNELIPYINKTYPSNGDNTLWGHSLGGLFVVYAMLNEPKTFKSYIAVDPSIWWDNCYVARIAADKLPALAGSSTTLFISCRDGADGKSMRTDTMDAVLKKSAPAGLTWKIATYSGETHSSLRLKGIYDGLKFIYTGYTGAIQFHPMNGTVLKDKPVKIWFFDDTTNMRYTIDGTAPIIQSARVQPEITLNGPARVTYKHFTMRSRYDKATTGDFTTEKTPKLVAKQKNLKPGGFNYAYYEGEWDKWPDVKSLIPAKTGITSSDFDVDKLPRKKNYALVIDGVLETKEEGYYMFLLNADKDSKLYLGDKLLIQWEGDYTHQTYSYIVPLKKGFYPFRIEYLHKNADFKLMFSYLTPTTLNTKNPKQIPSELQYGRN